MWNLKAKIESDDLNKQLQVNEKEAVDEKKKPSESQQIKPNLMEESDNEHYYQIKDKLFTEIINELNLKAVQDEKDNSSVRNAIKGLVAKAP
jgi:regulatory protein YycH of two-component signal transduction system YycFG